MRKLAGGAISKIGPKTGNSRAIAAVMSSRLRHAGAGSRPAAIIMSRSQRQLSLISPSVAKT